VLASPATYTYIAACFFSAVCVCRIFYNCTHLSHSFSAQFSFTYIARETSAACLFFNLPTPTAHPIVILYGEIKMLLTFAHVYVSASVVSGMPPWRRRNFRRSPSRRLEKTPGNPLAPFAWVQTEFSKTDNNKKITF
jgi:hypothetical protein